MTRLDELASLIRSKNAGPFSMTFDIMFDKPENYWRVKESRVLNRELFAHLYQTSPNRVRYFECDNAFAFKFSIPRHHASGDPGDADLHGGQHYAPLLEIMIP